MPMALGNFAAGFADAFRKSRQLRMMQEYYDSMQAYHVKLGKYYDSRSAYYDALRSKVENQPNPAAMSAEAAAGKPSMTHGNGEVGANAGEMRDFYVKEGYTPEGAAAIVGNWQQENSLKGGGWGGDNGTSAGGFQWHDDPSKGLYRGTGFMNWAKENNLDVKDPMTSAKYSIIDIKNNFKDLDKFLRTTHDVDEATQKFERDFEGASTPAMGNRLSAAHAVYAQKPSAPAAAEPKVEKASATEEAEPPETPGPQSRADTLPPSNQVASLDNDEAMRIAIAQQKAARQQGIVDPSTIARRAEAASRYGRDEPIRTPDDSTDLVRPGPLDQRAPEPGTRQDPQSAGVGPTESTAEQLEQLRLQRVNANTPETGFPPQPIPNISRDRGPPYPPPNVQPPPVPPVTTTEGRTDVRPYAPYEVNFPTDQTGRKPEMLVPTTQMPVDERNLPIPEARPSTVPPPPTPRVAEINAPVVGGDERLQPAAANVPAPNAQTVSSPVVGPTQAMPPGFVMQDRPNMDAISGPYHTGRGPSGGPAQMAMPDLSYLFNRGQPAPASAPAPVPVARPAPAPAPVVSPVASPSQPIPTTLPASVVANPPVPPVRPADAYPQPEARPSTVPPPVAAPTPAPSAESKGPISNAFTLNDQQQATLDKNDPGPPSAPAGPPQMPREESAPQQQLQLPTYTDDPVQVQPMVAMFPDPQPQPYPQSPVQRQEDQEQDYMQSARGGAVMRYDDGGDVGPTVAGPPPALSGAQQIPPIYYNPATYAAAGAPVGRGISASSIPTYVAAPVPTYRRGGEVMRFAAGGAAPTAAQLSNPGWQNTLSTYTLPGNAPFTNQQVYDLQNTINSQPYPFLSPLSPSGSKDLTGFYGAYTTPTPVASSPIQPTRVTKTVAPIGGTAVQMQPFTPPPTTNSSPAFAPQGSGSNLAKNNAPNTNANQTGGGNNSLLDPSLAALGWTDQNRNRNWGYARGGIVMRYADGADVDVPEPQAEQGDEAPMPGEPGGSPVPTPSFDPGQATQVAYNTLSSGRPSSPNAGSRLPALRAGPPPMIDPYAIMGEPSQGGTEPLSKAPPPGAPEIVNPQNPSQPSMGVLGSLISGFQHIVQQSGLDKSGQSPVQDPNALQHQIAVRQDIAMRHNGLTDKQFADTLDRTDPDHKLDLNMRLLGGMEDTYTRFVDAGDIDGAMKVSAMIAMKAIDISSRYGAQAAKYFRNGDWKTGVEALDNAQGYIPKDTKYQINKINSNGTGVASETDLAGNVIRTFNVNPEMLVAAAGGMANGQLAWHAYEAFAMKYLPGIKSQMDQEQQASNADALNASFRSEGQPPPGVQAPPAPAPGPQAPPATIPVGTTPPGGSPVPSPSSSPPITAQAPPTIDSSAPPVDNRPPIVQQANPGASPIIAPPRLATGPTIGPTQALASATTPPDVPAGAAEPVQFMIPVTQEQEAKSLVDAEQRIKAKYAPRSDGSVYIGDVRYAPINRNAHPFTGVPAQDAATRARLDKEDADYKWAMGYVDKQAKDEIAAEKFRISQEAMQSRQLSGQQHTDAATATREANTRADVEKKTADQRRYEGAKPRSPADVDRTFSEAIDPVSGLRSGRSPSTYLTAAYPKFATDFGLESQAAMARAIKSGYAYTNDAGPDDVANLITGIASGRYGYEAKPMKKDEFDDRYMITVTRPNPKNPDKPYKVGTFVLPVNDGDAVANIRQEFAGSLADIQANKEAQAAIDAKAEAAGRAIKSPVPAQGWLSSAPLPFMPSPPGQ